MTTSILIIIHSIQRRISCYFCQQQEFYQQVSWHMKDRLGLFVCTSCQFVPLFWTRPYSGTMEDATKGRRFSSSWESLKWSDCFPAIKAGRRSVWFAQKIFLVKFLEQNNEKNGFLNPCQDALRNIFLERHWA